MNSSACKVAPFFLLTIFLIHLRYLVQWFNGSMVPWFHGSMVICDCSAVQSAVRLAAAPVFLLGATRHFLLLSYKICALYGTFLRFFFFIIQVARLVIASILLSHRLLSR